MENLSLYLKIFKMLENYRKEIDTIDNQLIELLAQRMEVVKKVWEYKKEHNIQPLQKWRWQKVLENVVSKWKKYWLDREFIEDIWNRIHEEALKIES